MQRLVKTDKGGRKWTAVTNLKQPGICTLVPKNLIAVKHFLGYYWKWKDSDEAYMLLDGDTRVLPILRVFVELFYCYQKTSISFHLVIIQRNIINLDKA